MARLLGRLAVLAAVAAASLWLAPAAAAATVLSEGFESGAAGWQLGGRWSIAVPAAAYEGTHAAAFGHPADGRSGGALVSPSFSLDDKVSGHLTFAAWGKPAASGRDDDRRVAVDVSTDGGRSWLPLGLIEPSKPAWSGWAIYTLDLAAALGEPDVRLRFAFDVDGDGSWSGRTAFKGLLVDGVAVDADDPPADAPATQLVLGFQARAGQSLRPRRGRTVLIEPSGGRVTYELPGSGDRQVLVGATLVPVGSEIDTRRGAVKLSSVADEEGNLQTGRFHQGLFKVFQDDAPDSVTELALRGGAFPHWPRAGAAGAGGRAVRRLWGRARGRFRIRGRYAAATVRGTTWAVEDRESGTLVRVRVGQVTVDDLALGRQVTVRAGETYFVPVLYPNRKARNPRAGRVYSIHTNGAGRRFHVYERRRVAVG